MSLNEANLEKRFNGVSTSAGSIQSLSSVCLHYKNHHKRITQIWMRCLQKALVPHRLTLIYLANDIVQNAKRKNSLSFIEDFKAVLKDTVPYLRDEKIRKSVERVFSIWQDRSIFDSKFTTELKNALNSTGRQSDKSSTKSQATKESSSSSSATGSAGAAAPGSAQKLGPQEDLIECLNRLTGIEKSVDKLKSANDNIVDKLAQGPLSNGELSDTRVLEDLKIYITALKTEIEERNKLSKLLEESMATQKRLLAESEDQLVSYRNQFDQITKIRNELG